MTYQKYVPQSLIEDLEVKRKKQRLKLTKRLKRKLAYDLLQISKTGKAVSKVYMSDEEAEVLRQMLSDKQARCFTEDPIADVIYDYVKSLDSREKTELLQVLHERDSSLFADLFGGSND